MLKITSIEEIRELIEKENYCGFRNLTDKDLKTIESGRDYLDPSHVWEDGEMLEETLSGTCAVYIDTDMYDEEIEERYNQAKDGYMGSVIALIGDKNSEWGEDENEIILGGNGYGANILSIVEL